MNFYFFLDLKTEGLLSSVEIFNRPSIEKLTKGYKGDLFVKAFYSFNNKWHFHNLGKISKNNNLILNKTELPNDFRDKSVFISMSKNEKFNENFLIDEKEILNTQPEWRSNLKISSSFTSTSYQGEYPYSMTKRKLSLTSCSPMLQSGKNIKNLFFLVNLKAKPEIKEFELKLLTINNKEIDKFYLKTNSVNVIEIDQELINYYDKKNNNFFIFQSSDEGGIPIYFTKSNDLKMMSLEHTHPPTAYYLFGNSFAFQKRKKNFWSK